MRTLWGADEPSGSYQWETFSTDQGFSWSRAEQSTFRSPCSPLSMKRIPATGDLLVVWNDRSNRYNLPEPQPISRDRTPLVSAISSDEGKTWKHHTVIESAPDHGFCYTAIHFTEDAVLLGYCAGDEAADGILNRLRIRRIPLEELYLDQDK